MSIDKYCRNVNIALHFCVILQIEGLYCLPYMYKIRETKQIKKRIIEGIHTHTHTHTHTQTIEFNLKIKIINE